MTQPFRTVVYCVLTATVVTASNRLTKPRLECAVVRLEGEHFCCEYA